MSKKIYIMVMSFVILLLTFMSIHALNVRAEENPKKELIRSVLIKKLINSRVERLKAEKVKTEVKIEKEANNSIFDNRVWVTENNKADLIVRTKNYFSKFFPNSPVDPAELVNLALIHAFPLDFILINGHLESHMCTAGRGATSNNCHNVNNTDAGDYKPTVCGLYTQCNSNVYKGEVQFINLIKNCYMNENQAITLQAWLDQDFRVQRTVKPFCDAGRGARYMTDTKSLSKYQYGIKNWINPIFDGYNKN